jgi:hypothetical protein
MIGLHLARFRLAADAMGKMIQNHQMNARALGENLQQPRKGTSQIKQKRQGFPCRFAF